MTGKNILKEWFSNGKKPSQEQFWQWIESYWHKDEKLSQNNIEGLNSALTSKADLALLEAHMEDEQAHKLYLKADKKEFEEAISALESTKLNSVTIIGEDVTADLTDIKNPVFEIKEKEIKVDDTSLGFDQEGRLQYGTTIVGSDIRSVEIKTPLVYKIEAVDSDTGVSTQEDKEIMPTDLSHSYKVINQQNEYSLFDVVSLKSDNSQATRVFGIQKLTGEEFTRENKTILAGSFDIDTFVYDKGTTQGLDYRIKMRSNGVTITSNKVIKYESPVEFSGSSIFPNLKITPKTLISAPVNGGIENDGENFYITVKGIRYPILQSSLVNPTSTDIWVEWSKTDDPVGITVSPKHNGVTGGDYGEVQWFKKTNNSFKISNVYMLDKHDSIANGRIYNKIEIVIKSSYKGIVWRLPFIEWINGSKTPSSTIFPLDLEIKLLSAGYYGYLYTSYNRYVVENNKVTVVKEMKQWATERDETYGYKDMGLDITLELTYTTETTKPSNNIQDFIFSLRSNRLNQY